MLQKKLFTLACVLAILGIGACFLPPPKSAFPLPPYMAGARVLVIDVQDASTNEPFENAHLSGLTADQFNQQWNMRHLRVVTEGYRAAADATLHITILSKQAIPGRTLGENHAWKLTLVTRMELVGNDGRRIWLRDDVPITLTTWRSASATSFHWQSGSTRYDVAFNLASRAGAVIQYPNAHNLPTEHP